MGRPDATSLQDRATALQSRVGDLFARKTPITQPNVAKLADRADLLFQHCLKCLDRSGGAEALEQTTREVTKSLAFITTNLSSDAIIPAMAALRRVSDQMQDITAFMVVEETMTRLKSDKPKFMIGSNITPTAGSYRMPMMELIQSAASERGETVSDWIFDACLERLRVEAGKKHL